MTRSDSTISSPVSGVRPVYTPAYLLNEAASAEDWSVRINAAVGVRDRVQAHFDAALDAWRECDVESPDAMQVCNLLTRASWMLERADSALHGACTGLCPLIHFTPRPCPAL